MIWRDVSAAILVSVGELGGNAAGACGVGAGPKKV